MLARSIVRGIAFLIAIALGIPALSQSGIRLATWNIQSSGSVGSGEWNDTLDVIDRIRPDILCVQEIASSDVSSFTTLAAQAGYPFSYLGSTSGTLSGGFRNAVLSVHPIVFADSRSAADLSGDPNANDITRDIVEAHIQLPGTTAPLGVFVVHLKAGSGQTNDFRRAVEITRLTQATSAFLASNPQSECIILGDLNEDLGDGPFGTVYNATPGGLPQTYSLGNDISFPVVYDPFAALTGSSKIVADATHEDTTTIYETRPSSGRRLDYIIYGSNVLLAGDEVYDSARDNGIDDPPIGNFLTKFGMPLSSGTALGASDHLMVYADMVVGTGAGPLFPGTGEDLVMSTGVNGPVSTGPGNDCKTAAPGDAFYLHVVSLGGTFDLSPLVVVAQPFCLPGIPCQGALPGMWFDVTNPVFVVVNGFAPPFFQLIVPVTGNLYAFQVPAGFTGTEFSFQSMAFSAAASNGFLAFTDAHKIVMQ